MLGKGDGGGGVFHGGSLVQLVRLVEWDLNFFGICSVTMANTNFPTLFGGYFG